MNSIHVMVVCLQMCKRMKEKDIKYFLSLMLLQGDLFFGWIQDLYHVKQIFMLSKVILVNLYTTIMDILLWKFIQKHMFANLNLTKHI